MDVTLPELGENITRATVLDVLVGAGDQVEKDQALLTLESDKAEFDLPSPESGKVAEVLVARGDEIEVGQVIVRLESGQRAGATAKPAQKDGGRPAAAPAKDTPAQQTPAADSSRPARSSTTAAKPAGKTAKPTPSETAETVDLDAPDGAGEEEAADVEQQSAPAKKIAAKPRAEQPKATAPDSSAQREASAAAESADGDGASQAPASGAERTPIAAAPSVRRLARELGVDAAEVARAASKDRVTAEDVYRYVRSRLAPGKTDGGAGDATGRDYSRWGEVEEIPMSTVRRKTAERMSLAWSSIPHVTHHDLADITDLERLRKQYAPRVERAGGKLTITAVLLKVLGSALRKHPKFNASVDMERAVVVEKHFVNVGVAVDTERGLLVPVIRRVDEKNILELALELRDLSEAARTRKIRPEQLQGATFTVTNLGGIGGTHFNPLINPPEVAVLGMSRSDLRQVWVDGRFEARELLPLSVSYDHRIIDGADAARFLRWVCDALAEPFLMDLEGE